jgi:hypothetical protein
MDRSSSWRIKSPGLAAKTRVQAIHLAHAILWVSSDFDVWLVKDRFNYRTSDLPLKLL